MKRFLMLLTALMLSATTALAVPNTMNYQGQLFLNGSPTSGPVSITFRMYDAETNGNLLWTETDNVTVTGGLFTTILGDGTVFPANLFTAQIPWLEMEVNGQVFIPRTQLKSVPYAFQAQRADSARWSSRTDTANVALSGTGGNELWSTDGTNVWRSTGSVGVGTSTPGQNIDTGAATMEIKAPNALFGPALAIRADAGGRGIRLVTQDFNSNGNVGTQLSIEPGRLQVHTSGTAAYGNLFLQGDGGNVGLGTYTPGSDIDLGTARLEVRAPNSTFGPALAIRSDADGRGIRLVTQNFSNTNNIGNQLTIEPWGVSAYTNGTSAHGSLLLQSDGGNVGIGTSNATVKLDVAGSARIANEVGIGADPIGGVPLRVAGFVRVDGGAAGSIRMMSNGANGIIETLDYTPVTIQPSGGNVAIGNGVPTAKLHVFGDFCATGTKNRLVHEEKWGDLYYHSTESARALFTIEGEGRMTDGVAHVQLDPKWLAGVTIDEEHPMQVWITFYGPHGNYYVERANSNNGFKVVDPSGSNAAFGWKVEARQKGYEDVYLDRKPQPTAATR